MRTIALALVVGALLSATAVALASGGPPPDRGYPPPGVTAIGFASSPVHAKNTDGEARIRRAVAAANARARPRAYVDARARAAELAAAAGMKVGAVWSVSQDPNVPYYGNGVVQGTFGGNDYCGRVRRAAGYRTTEGGRRVRRYVYRQGCRAPKEVTVYLTVTYAQG